MLRRALRVSSASTAVATWTRAPLVATDGQTVLEMTNFPLSHDGTIDTIILVVRSSLSESSMSLFKIGKQSATAPGTVLAGPSCDLRATVSGNTR
ncbi:hypothetical protein F4775DRAFT_578345 [Biscogniauxia sp. FL1348]|nr:hypothetical protein F4775DRAFT_578345 [Biscogniauxia sp. FL1348]